nr:MAG TPA: hypothetical protein [Caudoviricetes sp.]
MPLIYPPDNSCGRFVITYIQASKASADLQKTSII